MSSGAGEESGDGAAVGGLRAPAVRTDDDRDDDISVIAPIETAFSRLSSSSRGGGGGAGEEGREGRQTP